MKRKGNLFETVASMDNLILADQKARKRKEKSYGVMIFDRHAEEKLLKLQGMFLNGMYKTSAYDIFTIETPKKREIYRLPYFPDRIAHHAIMNVLEPIWVSVFTSDTYSCIKGRGIHSAATKVKRTINKDPENTKYCLKLDITKFYPSIDHDVLKAIVRRKIKDVRLLQLLDEIIDSADGVPIGNYLSQYFANLYLAYFDHWVKEELKVKYYFRYADDMVILSNSKVELHALFEKIEEYLNRELKLQIKGNWQVFPVEDRGVDFLGYIFRKHYVLIRKAIKKNIFRKVKKLRNKHLTEREYKMELSSHLGWLKHANTKNLKNKISYENIFRQSA